MVYEENSLKYEDYCRLRESVGWLNFSRKQAENAIGHSCHTITARLSSEQRNPVVGMGRIIGDGMYFTIVDVVVQPEYQGMGIGTKIVGMLMQYAESMTPAGGRSSIQLIAEKGKEDFYESMGFKTLPHEFCGCGMRKVLYGKEGEPR